MRLLASVLVAAIAAAGCASAAPEAPPSPAPSVVPLAPAHFADEPPVTPGMTALRFANQSDCAILLRAQEDGTTVRTWVVRPHSTLWVHAHPVDVAFSVDVLVAPRFCGTAVPRLEQPADTTPRPPRGQRITVAGGS